MGNAKTRALETLAAVHGADLMASLAPGDRHVDRWLMGLENMAYFLLQHHPRMLGSTG